MTPHPAPAAEDATPTVEERLRAVLDTPIDFDPLAIAPPCESAGQIWQLPPPPAPAPSSWQVGRLAAAAFVLALAGAVVTFAFLGMGTRQRIQPADAVRSPAPSADSRWMPVQLPGATVRMPSAPSQLHGVVVQLSGFQVRLQAWASRDPANGAAYMVEGATLPAALAPDTVALAGQAMVGQQRALRLTLSGLTASFDGPWSQVTGRYTGPWSSGTMRALVGQGHLWVLTEARPAGSSPAPDRAWDSFAASFAPTA